jgi:energy-coupling factor transport system ATP-binding protein
VITFDRVTVVYPDTVRPPGSVAAVPVLRDVSFAIPEGELALVVGRTGAGKSTLLRAVNGLVPHFTGGVLHGRVTVDGRDTRTHPPRELADVVGVVLQDPRAGFVTDTVEDELAYAMEAIGVAPDVMRRRVEETLDLLGLQELRDRPLRSLSGGQQQRVAIGSVLTTHPKVLVLDEPTSALDPNAAEEVLAALHRLVHDLGITVLMAEHRLERVVQFADRLLLVDGSGAVTCGSTADMLQHIPIVPPVVELARAQGWAPLPVSVRDARRQSTVLRTRLVGLAPPTPVDRAAARHGSAPASLTASRLSVTLGATTALDQVDLQVHPGEVVAVMGRNGAGKSTLLRTCVGLAHPSGGALRVGADDPATLPPSELIRQVGLVPQEPADLLWSETVGHECADADRDASAARGTTRRLLETLAPGVGDSTHPRDLSEGQRLALALAVIVAADPPLLLLDEPTRGLDYPTKARLVGLLTKRAAAGRSVVLATHDVELVAEAATRVVVLADGEVVADGPARAVLLASPQFAPQVAKVLAPLPWLTVGEVATSLREAG